MYGFADGKGKAAQFKGPRGIAIDSKGDAWICDSWNHRIRIMTRDGTVTTACGNGDEKTADGVGTAASFHYPLYICFNSDKSVAYFTEKRRVRAIDIATRE